MWLLNWVSSNKEWIFSGIGIPIITFLIYKFKMLYNKRIENQAKEDLEKTTQNKSVESYFFPQKSVFDLEKLFDDAKSGKISELQIDEINRLGKIAKIISEGLVTQVFYYESLSKISIYVKLNQNRNEKNYPWAYYNFPLSERPKVVPVCIGDWVMVEGHLNIEDYQHNLGLNDCSIVFLRKGEKKFPEDFISEKKTT
jgi:hypothetical protein